MSPAKRISYTTMPSKEAMDGMAWDPYSDLADLAGVKLDKSMAEAGKLSNFQTFTPPSHTHTCTHEEQSVKNVPPAFPEYPWPAFLKRMIDRGDTPAQRDILLLGAITVLGATLNKSIRISYGRKFYYPCLQTFIVAPPASGKGMPSLGHAGLPSRYTRR